MKNTSNNLKKMTLISALITGVVGILIGILLLCISAEKLFSILSILLGLIGVIVTLPPFLDAVMHNGRPGSATDIILHGIVLLISLALIFTRNFVVMILVGIFLVIVPVVRIARATDTFGQFKQDLPRILIGIVLICIGPCRVIDTLFSIVGWIVIAISVLDLIWNVFAYFHRYERAESVTKGTRTFVDVTGDGKIDTVYIDTTGDGKTDTEIPYDRKKKDKS